jgi:hypothetical protein
MKFVVNRYNIDLPIRPEDSPPMAECTQTYLPYGLPPFEMRQIWVIELVSLEDLTRVIEKNGAIFDVSKSGFWSGTDIQQPGERLFGMALMDDPSFEFRCASASRGRAVAPMPPQSRANLTA